jgi:hypothetical protein
MGIGDRMPFDYENMNLFEQLRLGLEDSIEYSKSLNRKKSNTAKKRKKNKESKR